MGSSVRIFILLATVTTWFAQAQQSISYTYDAAGRLSTARYAGGKTLTYSWDGAGNLLRTLVATPVAGATPAFAAQGVLNSASYVGGSVAPGELIVIFGTGLGPATLGLGLLTPLGSFDSYTSETTVLFDGVPAPVIYSFATQTSVAVPYAVTGRASTQIVVQYQGRASPPVTMPVAATVPGLFSANASGTGNGVILNENLSVNSPSNPAVKGSVIVLYGTGEGQTNPRSVDGRIAVGVYPAPALPMKATISGTQTEVLYAGSAPGITAGVFQMNLRLPANVASGAVPVVVTVGSAATQTGLTVSVK
jgi:uncharacterized protein (TIGR03437 family)